MCLYIDTEEIELGDLDNEVWVLVELPPNGKTVGSKWLFKKKTNMDGVVHTYKARLVAKGYTQTLGIDYEETFSPVADIRAIRILIAISTYYDYKIWKMDVKTAFLNGHLNEEVYIEQPEGFVNLKYPNRNAKQSIFATSYAEAEYIVAFDASKVKKDFEIVDSSSRVELIPSKNKSTRTRHALDRICLYIDAEEHELGDLGKPANYKAALLDPKSEKWLNVMNVEMQSMKDNKVWVLVELPPNGKTVGKVYIEQPEGFVNPKYPNRICKLKHSIYGLKQASRLDILNGGTVYWKNAKQSIFATSSAEAEYIDAFDASKEAVWVRKFISWLGLVPTIEEPICIYCDNTGAIAIANESGITKGARHFCAKVHYHREFIKYGDIKLETVHTYEMLLASSLMSTRTRHALDRICLYIDAEEHLLGDLGEPANYKAALLDPMSKKWPNVMNVEMQSMKDNEVWVLVEVCKLKPIYGLKQASRQWNKHFDDEIKKFDFSQNHDEPCVHLKASGSNITFLILYVDDILIMGNNIPELQIAKSYLGRRFPMKDPSEVAYILGIKIYKDRARWLIGLCQSAYIKKILKRYCMENSKRGSIPMQEKLKLSKSQSASTPAELKCMYCVPYALAVGDLKWVLRVSCYTYARYLMDVDDLKSLDILNGGTVYWKNAKQSIFSTSSVEAKYIDAFDASKEAVWVRKFISGLGVVPTLKEPISIYCNNTGAIAIANESGITKGARHFCAKVHYLHKVIEYGDIKLETVHTDENLADPFTKALAFPKHSKHIGTLECFQLAVSFLHIRRSTRTRHALDRMCLYIDAEEHELGDLNEPANYKAALLDLESKKWLNVMNVEMQSMKDNEV
nr:hypothetical protein [Tanacetum cinerariifolium]